MGQTESVPDRRGSKFGGEAARFQIRSTSKAPSKIIIEKPKVQDSKPILQVPHTNVKIMHVDPTERAGIVPTHGYIALQIVPPEERTESDYDSLSPSLAGSGAEGGRTKKRGRNASPRKRRSSSLKGMTEEEIQQDVVDAGMDPEYIAMLQRARAEYSEEGHRHATREVRKWKAAFALENGRNPNKKDIANAPYIFEQYYREKEFDAMKKLIDDNAEAERVETFEGGQTNLIKDLTELDVARSEYNAMEFLDLHREVKRWKIAFKATHGRQPSKKDVADAPEIFDKYYRVKELEAMKKLIDEAEAVENALAAAGSGGGGGAFDEEHATSGVFDPVENAKAQFDAAELTQLNHDVRHWKMEFKASRGRPPTKRDISEDPEMFTMYYREKELEAMKKLIEDTQASMRRASVIDGLEALDRAKLEYDATEHETLQREVKEWKRAFKEANGRPPTKRDISADPDAFAKYYREKELETMKQLTLEASERPQPARSNSIRRSSSIVKNEEEPTEGSRRDSKRRRSEQPAAADAMVTAAVSEAGGQDFPLPTDNPEHVLSFAEEPAIVDNAGVDNHPPAPGYTSKAPEPLSGFAPRYDAASKQAGATPPTLDPFDIADAEEDDEGDRNVATQFVFPRGHQAAERVYFFDTALQLDDKGAAMLGMQVQGAYDPVAAAHKYEVEEDEIFEMAGIHRPQAMALDEDDDPLATYELHSNVLEALRLAIDAPMSDFGGGGDAVYDAALQSFIEEAMHEAHDLFEDQRVMDEAYQKTYSMAQMAHTKSSRAGMGRRLMSKVKSRAQSAMRMHMTAIEAPSPSEANSSGLGGADDEDDAYAGWSHEDMVRERKQLHKLLNNYKNQFIEHHGRGPEAFEMAQDPQVRDAYAQYHVLKKKTKSKMEAVVDAAVMQAEADPRGDVGPSAEADGGAEGADAPTQQQGFNPFAKVLENMNESAARRDRLLEPIGGAEEEPVMSPQEQELDILSKEMKIWKRGFKEREGRNPTRRDIKNDPDFAEKYFRMKELESILGKEGSTKKKRRSQQHDDEEGRDDEGHDEDANGNGDGPPSASEGEGGQSPTRTPRKAQQQLLRSLHDSERVDAAGATGASPPDDGAGAHRRNDELPLEEAIAQLAEGERINRRDVEADEDIAIRLMWGQGMSVGIRVAASSLREDDDEGGQVNGDDDAPIGASIASYRAFSDAADGSADNARPLPANTPILDLGDGVQERPQPGGTPAPSAVAQGWSFPMDDAVPANETGAATAAAGGEEEETEQAAEPQLSPEELKEQRKAVAKELNQWKAHFKMVNSKAPTAKDIKQHPHIQALFEKYQVLTKAVEAHEAADATKDKETVRPAPLTLSKHPSSRSASPQAALLDEDGAPLTPLRTAKHHRQRLAKEISEWRIAFRVHEGHAPVLKDIIDTPSIAAAYEEYTQLNDYVAEREGVGARSGMEADVNETVALALRRKQLGRTLNEWKAQFFDTYGRNPNVRDIKTNKQASAMYEEYNLIPKNVEDDAAHQLEMEDHAEANDEEMQFKEAKIRKKELNKILNEWKAQFAESMGRKPKVSDILADAVVAAVYGEYQELQAALQDAKERPPPAAAKDDAELRQNEGAVSPTHPGHAATAWAAAPDDGLLQLAAATAAHDDNAAATTPERPQTPIAKQKKRVTKQLNQWKSEFAAREGRNPTKADIKKDETAFALFQSYQALKEQLQGTGGGGDDGEGGHEDDAHTHPSTDVTPQPARGGAWSETPQPPTEAAMHASPEAASPPPPPAQEAADTAATEAQQPQHEGPTADAATLKATKKALNKRLNTWKMAFTEEHGKAPKQTDIQQNPEMLSLYEELKALKLQLKHMDGDGADDA